MTSNASAHPTGASHTDATAPSDPFLTAPDPVALSTTTTAYDATGQTPRTSRDSMPKLNPFETDVEAVDADHSASRCKRKSAHQRSDHLVWPGKDHWRQVAKAAKRKRGCACMARMSRRNRIITKIAIVVLVVGGAMAIGFGISKSLGAGIWDPNH